LEIIREEIRESGPISFCRFVETSLFHPEHGYYSSGKAKIGKKGDFYTAPSVHCSFGETISRFLAEVSLLLEGESFTVVEFGASGGQLALDILEALSRNHPGLYSRTNYMMIETSPGAVLAAREVLKGHHGRVRWIDNLQEIGKGGFRGVVIANEFLDSLPFHRLKSDGEEIREIFLSLCSGEIREILQDPEAEGIHDFSKRYLEGYAQGEEAEACLLAGKWLADVEGALQKGFVLCIDYGSLAPELYSPGRRKGTFRCFYRHQLSSDPYTRVGEQDITADVNFSELMRVGDALGLSTVKYTTQGQFLVDWGILEIFKTYDKPQNQGDRLAAKTLFMPEFMGRKFKVLLQSKGFSPEELSGLDKDQPFRIIL
jgi:SAM-dependent MidA family methyltransferase